MNISFTSLVEVDELEELIVKHLKLSKSQAKKFLTKKELKKRVTEREEVHLPINLLNVKEINPTYTGKEIEVLYEDENFLGLHKPCKIHCHPQTYNESDNILSWLRANNKPECLDVNTSNYDRGLLYRLDFETSGVLILAKKQNLYEAMRTDFQSLMKEKTYFALVKGEFTKFGEHIHYLNSSGVKGEKVVVVNIAEEHVEGKKACLEADLHTYDKEKDVSLLEVSLKTGHRHQIRVQLAALGFPIIGDSLYGGVEHERLCLHAKSYKLSFQKIELCIESLFLNGFFGNFLGLNSSD